MLCARLLRLSMHINIGSGGVGGRMLDVISPPTTTAICLKRSADAARDLIQRSSFFFLLRSPSSDHLFQNCARAFADLALRRTEPS